MDAVKDLILDKNPCASVVAIRMHLQSLIRCCAMPLSASLIVVTTDVDVAKRKSTCSAFKK